MSASTQDCRVCDEPITVYHGPHLITVNGKVRAIRDAINHATAHPSCTAREGYQMEYVTQEGYYPGDTEHFIDISDYPPEHRGGAFLDAYWELAKRGLMINSVRWEEAKLHVVMADWLTEKLPDTIKEEIE